MSEKRIIVGTPVLVDESNEGVVVQRTVDFEFFKVRYNMPFTRFFLLKWVASEAWVCKERIVPLAVDYVDSSAAIDE